MKKTNLIYQTIKKRYAGKKVLIVGLGIQGGGLGLVKFFTKVGSQITVTDKKTPVDLKESLDQLKEYPINYRLGQHCLKDFLSANVIFKGPSVPWTLPEIVAAKKKGVPVKMELSFVAKNFPGKIIGITGTRGKSTTTMMIYQILKDQKKPVLLGGGLPGISTINYLQTATKNSLLVMELSSWALSGFHQEKISPPIAVFTSFYPDHLNFYQSLNDYLFDKKAIYLYQKNKDFLIANQTLKKTILKDRPKSRIFFYQGKDFNQRFAYLSGQHNQENAAAALITSQILGLNKEKTLKTLKNFRGLPFRQQVIAKKNNFIFINDTTSTTPTATEVCLKTFANKDVILILGGNSKNLPFNNLVNALATVKKIVLLDGSFTKEILPTLKIRYRQKITPIYSNLEEAVKKAYQLAKESSKKIYILFSPAATSFAMFKNEFDRGQRFNQIVKKILG